MAYKLGKDILKLFKPGILGIIDKSEAEGLVVSLKGDKIVICRGKDKAVGVYTAGNSRKMLLLSGEKVEIVIPEGIIYQGSAQVKRIRG